MMTGRRVLAVVKWEIVEWFGDIQGIRNTGTSYAEDVLVYSEDRTLLADVYVVEPSATIDFATESAGVSVSWRDSNGMHADIVRVQS